MKFLGDMGVSLSTVSALRTAGHDATHLREHGLPKLPDPEIFQNAALEGLSALTFDLEFPAIVTVEDAGYRLRRLPLFKNPPPP